MDGIIYIRNDLVHVSLFVIDFVYNDFVHVQV